MKNLFGLIMVVLLSITVSFAAAPTKTALDGNYVSGGIASTISSTVAGVTVTSAATHLLWSGIPAGGWEYILAFDSLSDNAAGEFYLYACDPNGVVLGTAKIDTLTVANSKIPAQYLIPFCHTIVGATYKIYFVNAISGTIHINRMYIMKRRTIVSSSATSVGGGFGN
jgi:hypothetical protein